MTTKGRRWQPWLIKGHGTEARARRHQREGEKPCPACKEAARQAKSRRKTRNRERAA